VISNKIDALLSLFGEIEIDLNILFIFPVLRVVMGWMIFISMGLEGKKMVSVL